MKTPCCEKCREYRESPNGGGSYYACVSLNCPCHKSQIDGALESIHEAWKYPKKPAVRHQDKLTSEDFVKLNKLVDMNIEIMNNHQEKGIKGNKGPDDSGITGREKDWQERFDAMIQGRLGGYGDQILYRENDIKSFIKELLKEERERLIRLVEGMDGINIEQRDETTNTLINKSDLLDLLRKG
jgi:hypothetical protein